MKDQNASFPQDLPWGSEDPEIRNDACSDEYYGEDVHGAPWEPTLTIDEVSHLLDQMVMDIQHLELEVIRARYRLSFFLNPPYDKYLRSEIFSNMGTRYGNIFGLRYLATWARGMAAIPFTTDTFPTVGWANTMTP